MTTGRINQVAILASSRATTKGRHPRCDKHQPNQKNTHSSKCPSAWQEFLSGKNAKQWTGKQRSITHVCSAGKCNRAPSPPYSIALPNIHWHTPLRKDNSSKWALQDQSPPNFAQQAANKQGTQQNISPRHQGKKQSRKRNRNHPQRTGKKSSCGTKQSIPKTLLRTAQQHTTTIPVGHTT
jgi:hypothetical protein